MAELADAHGSGPCGSNTMRVQVSFPARESLSRFAEVFVLQKYCQVKFMHLYHKGYESESVWTRMRYFV